MAGCRRPPAPTQATEPTAPPTATAAMAQPTPTTPVYLPSTVPTTFISPSGWYTVTLPPPWKVSEAIPSGVPAELAAIRPTSSGEPLASLTIETAPTGGITLEQQVAAAAQELEAQTSAHIEQNALDTSYRLIDRPIGAMDYSVEMPAGQPTAAGTQYTIYAQQPERFIFLTFTGQQADLAALREEMELILATVATAD